MRYWAVAIRKSYHNKRVVVSIGQNEAQKVTVVVVVAPNENKGDSCNEVVGAAKNSGMKDASDEKGK